VLEYVAVTSQHYVSVRHGFVSKNYPVQSVYGILLLCAQAKSSQIPTKTILRIFVSCMWVVVIHGDNGRLHSLSQHVSKFLIYGASY
jgi:hypothetical protein